MKKLTAFFLALVLVCSLVALTSCAPETAAQLMADSYDKLENLDSLEAEMSVDMNISSNGVSIEMPMQYYIKAASLKTDPIFSADVSLTMMGETMNMDLYMGGGYIYASVLGQNMKIPVDSEDADDYNALNELTGLTKELPAEQLAEAEIVQNEDGSRKFTIQIDQATFDQLYKDFAESITESAAGLGVSFDVSVSDAEVTVTVNSEGYISVYRMSCNMTLTEETSGTATEVALDTTVTFKNPGAAVTVTPPAGYQDYPEIPSM